MIDLKIRELFFDRQAVTGAVDTATRKVLSRFGSFVRRTARSRIRKRKTESDPGSPPSSHSGLLRKFIFFGYEPQKKSVVIGPARLTKVGDAPHALEYGGASATQIKGQRKRILVRPRPFMGPAFEAERPKLPAMWRDSVQ